MDTRFWGPSGWKLLHHATYVYDGTNKKAYREFFESVPYILPCKYCRTSLTDYYEELPLDLDHLIKWLYNIHNKVNDKLRSQGLHVARNPTFQSVQKQYREWIKDTQERERMALFWDFLFSVAYNHPKEASRNSEPMKGCPPTALHCSNPCIKNRWNILPAEQRIHWYKQFWLTLPAVLGPVLGPEWRSIEKTTHQDLTCRRSVIAWLWRQRCAMDSQFHDPYTSVCQNLTGYSSDCEKARKGKSSRKITCRRTRKRRSSH
jgi:hypothetical protein